MMDKNSRIFVAGHKGLLGSALIKKLKSKGYKEIVGYRGEIEWDTDKPDGTPRKLLDSSRFFALGCKPLTDIEDRLKITYEWYIKCIIC